MKECQQSHRSQAPMVHQFLVQQLVRGDWTSSLPPAACRCLCLSADAPDAVRAAGGRLRRKRLSRLRRGWRYDTTDPLILRGDRYGAPTFGQLQHFSLRSPNILEAFPRLSHPQIRRPIQPIQLSANFHCSCDCQNCRAGRSPATLQLPVHESPFTNTARFSVASFYRNRTDRHIGPHPFRQRSGRDIPRLPAGFVQMF